MLNRRKFITQAALATGSVLVSPKLAGAAEMFAGTRRLTLLHTNDTHSRIEPFPMDGSRNQGLGGVAGRSHLINNMRSKQAHTLLVDAGDIFQGTPYFNIYKGEPEIRAMSAMGYDATTIGNHDFDAGLENLATQLRNHANFPMIVSNYDFTGTPMETIYKPYEVFEKGRLKIGIIGLGIELDGLVPENLYGATKYLDPVQHANRYAAVLKQKGCDLVICLSHLGYKYDYNRISDLQLAPQTENIDVIIGGHTHTFLDAPVTVKNKTGTDVLINQVGWAGIMLGRMDFIFEEKKNKKLVNAKPLVVNKKTEE